MQVQVKKNVTASAMIDVPCKASELEEAIRRFCEPNGLYEKAVVKAYIFLSNDSVKPRISVRLRIEENFEMKEGAE